MDKISYCMKCGMLTLVSECVPDVVLKSGHKCINDVTYSVSYCKVEAKEAASESTFHSS